jgi:formate hydrogenlyase subunit 6/NADH:ubiquinone oxidoreductase subunit I
MINEVKEVVSGSVQLAKSMGVTLKYFFKKPVTN